MKKGFTIIETLLVLSISALFAVGMMVGWSANINRERYNDAVNTFKSDLQAVFDEVKNPTNSRAVKVKCNTSTVAVSLSVDNTTGQDRGSSNCVLLGKLILFSSPKNWIYYAREDYTVIDIIGKDIDISKDCSGPCNNSIEAIKATKLTLSVGKNQVTPPTRTTLEWNSTYKTVTDNRIKSGTTRKFSGNFFNKRSVGNSIDKVILVRSPLDGSVLAFGLDDNDHPNYSILGTATKQDINMLHDQIFARIAAAIDERLLITPEHKVSICVRGQFTGNNFGGIITSGSGNKNKIIHITGGDPSDIEIDSLDAVDGSYCDNATGRIYSDDVFNGDIVIDGVKI